MADIDPFLAPVALTAAERDLRFASEYAAPSVAEYTRRILFSIGANCVDATDLDAACDTNRRGAGDAYRTALESLEAAGQIRFTGGFWYVPQS